MYIKKLEIENIRAIKKLALKDLKDTVVIAGPNGCGKSSIFDAIRLVKSIYGGYQNNEIDQWFSEFQIDLSKPAEITKFFRDPTQRLRVNIEIQLSKKEKDFIDENVESLIRASNLVNPSNFESRYYQRSIAAQIRAFGSENRRVLTEQSEKIRELLKADSWEGELVIEPGPKITIRESPLLELIFSTYVPNNIGVIDYHGPYRNYNREKVGGINLSIESEEQRMSQSALYNYANKYSNIKSEMASSYIRDLISKESGIKINNNDLAETLKELFANFFPGKEFLGPVPTKDGLLKFQVKLLSGEAHDIDELSSGEKEVLYGYLRIRNSTPKNSVLLLDEPELHLNPRLTKGLPSFYEKYIGRTLKNQIWLVTHSDSILRESIGRPDFSIYAMSPMDNLEKLENQAHTIDLKSDLDKAIVDLVGDLAIYQPALKKVIIFEGGGDSEFDKQMTLSLFPEMNGKVNMLSGGDKIKVRSLHEVISRIAKDGKLPIDIYSIIDKDTEVLNQKKHKSKSFTWNVYHIENYLLNEHFIFQAIEELQFGKIKKLSEDELIKELKKSAETSMRFLVNNKLQKWANGIFIKGISVSGNLVSTNLSLQISKSIIESTRWIQRVASADLTITNIQVEEKKIEQEYRQYLSDERWQVEYRGRDILKDFCSRILKGVPYEVFRNLIIRKMVLEKFQPPGMRSIIDQILNS